jgi:hypothetical protein
MGLRRRPRKTKKAEQSSNRLTFIVIGSLVAIALIGLGYLLYLQLQGPPPIEPIAGVVDHEHQERDHVEHEIEAGDLPPVGGSHNPAWQNCGIYDEPVSVENAVHSLEHGAMWIAYRPELPAEEVETLRDLARGEDFVLMSPYPGLRSPIVLTAWETQLELESADDERIPEFIERYQQGPTTPELGATCQDGVGTPIG